LYRDLSEKRYREWYGVTEKDKPEVAIIWGIFSSIAEDGFNLVPAFLKFHFRPYLKNIRYLKLPHTFVGDYKGLKIAVTHAYGGAFSLDQALKLKKFGAKLIILLGHFGGLKDDLAVGKIFIPSAAYRSDGASYHLLEEADRYVHPTAEIENWLHNHLKRKKIPFETGPIKTVSTMTAQTAEMITQWKRQGFVGVDLESAVIFSVGKITNIKTIAILHHSDHVGGGKLMPDLNSSEIKAKKCARKLIVKLALRVAEKFGK
jgi:purine-nucleoside phosphorylase